jgi:hypothetical protein
VASSDAGLSWIKSSPSFSNGNCVEVASLPNGGIGVRDSKDPSGPVLQFTPANGTPFSAVHKTGSSTSFNGRRCVRCGVLPGAWLPCYRWAL